MVRINVAMEVNGEEGGGLFNDGALDSMPDFEFFVRRGLGEGFVASVTNKPFNKLEGRGMDEPVGAENEGNDVATRGGAMCGQVFRDLALMCGVKQ